MTPARTVTFSLNAFKRARFVDGGKVLWLDTTDDWERARQALDAVTTELTDQYAEAEAESDEYLRITEALITPKGPMAFVDECEPSRVLLAMLDAVANGLAARGVQGQLRPAKRVDHQVFDNGGYNAAGAIMVLPIDVAAYYSSGSPSDPNPRSGWWVTPEQDERAIAPVVRWVLSLGGQTWLSIGAMKVHADPSSVLEFVIAALHRGQPSPMSVRSTIGDSRMRQVEPAGRHRRALPLQPRSGHSWGLIWTSTSRSWSRAPTHPAACRSGRRCRPGPT